MKRYGIIGGTFDPIHFAHLYIAYEAKEKLSLDKIIFMPNGSPPHKRNKRVTEASLRYKMVLEAIKGYEGFEVSDFEILKEGLSYTYQTLEYLKKKYIDAELFFITGADCLINLDKWVRVDRILNSANLVVFDRPGFREKDLIEEKKLVENKYDKKITFLNLKDLDISSTDIRERIKEGKRVDFFLPEEVKTIIEKNKLYKKEI